MTGPQMSDAAVLFTRPLWVDEWFTVLVASRPTPAAVIGDLAHGADGGASLLHLAVWTMGAVTGSLSPPALRAMSLACVVVALCLVYAVLRRRFSRDASIAGMLAAGSHRLVVGYAFEGRFYGPWLLCCAFFAWTLSRRTLSPQSRREGFVMAIAAALLCTIHWYGVISLGLMTAAAVAAHGRRWRDGVRLVAPSAAGLLALIAVVPLAVGQSRAISVASWVTDFAPKQLTTLLTGLWLATVPVAAAGGLAAALLLGRTPSPMPRVDGVVRRTLSDPGIAALLALALMPFGLALLSLLGQPSMLARYAIPAVLAWAPWVALAAELLGRWPARAASAMLVWVWFGNFTREAAKQRVFTVGVERERTAFRRAESMGVPVVFTSLHTMYPVVGRDRARGTPAVFLELPDSTLTALFPETSRFYQLNKGMTLERDFARVHADRFGFPRLASPGALDTTPRFLLFSTGDRLPRGMQDASEYGQALFPNHGATRLSNDLWLLERPATPAER